MPTLQQALPPDRKIAIVYSFLAAATEGIATFLAIAALLQPGPHVVATRVFSLSLVAFLTVAADDVAAVAQIHYSTRGFRMWDRGVETVFLPAHGTTHGSGQVVYRSPILHLRKAWHPEGGIPWAGLRLVVWGRDRERSSLVVKLLPMGGACGGRLLFPRVPLKISRSDFVSAASQILTSGSAIDLVQFTVAPEVCAKVRRFGTLRRYGGLLRLRSDLSRADLGTFHDLILSPQAESSPLGPS